MSSESANLIHLSWMELVLSQHISRLLFEHECVIVPDFGAFLTRYHHAEVNPATHMMRPPSRRIYFNPQLKENDGLLAKSISLTDRRTYKEALSIINNEVACWKDILSSGEKVQLKGIGRLFIDELNKLQFAPGLENNYQRASYGLSIFRSPAVEREVRIRTAIQKSIETHKPQPARPAVSKEQPKREPVRIPWAAVLGPVIFAGIIGAAYLGIQSESIQNASGLTWLEWTHSKSLYNISGEVIDQEVDDATKETAAEESTLEESNEVLPELNTAETAAEEIPLTQLYPYHIVVGSFKDAGNAQNYVSQLQARGFDAYAAEGDNRYMRVAVGNFATREQAENALRGVRQSINSQAWIYTN